MRRAPDIFRSDDLSGWGKALWALVVLIIPLLGVLIYLIVRGGNMHERAADEEAARDRATQQYIRAAADTGDGECGTADVASGPGSMRRQG